MVLLAIILVKRFSDYMFTVSRRQHVRPIPCSRYLSHPKVYLWCRTQFSSYDAVNTVNMIVIFTFIAYDSLINLNRLTHFGHVVLNFSSSA